MRLIDADKMLYKLTHWQDSHGWYHDNRTDVYHISEIRDVCDRMPTVDAVERKRGKWREYSTADGMNQCSECGVLRFGESNYCPNCGADMRGEANE